METETLEPITEQRILIHSNDQEIQRITTEAETRARLLNDILTFELVNNTELKQIATSEKAIKDFIFGEHLKVNKTMQAQHKAGKRITFDEYRLPSNLEALMNALQAWMNYPTSRNADKFQYLIYTDSWKVDEGELESYFVRMKYKMYISGQAVEELKTLQTIRAYLLEKNAAFAQIFSVSFFNDRFCNDSSLACNKLEQGFFMIKKSYFMR